VQVDALSADVAFTRTVRVPDVWPAVSRLLAATDTGIFASAASASRLGHDQLWALDCTELAELQKLYFNLPSAATGNGEKSGR
jgi:hypothetical protein